MKLKNILTCAAVPCLGLLLAASPVAHAADAAAAGAVHKGTATLRLTTVKATLPNGSPDPAHDAACKKQLSQPQSKYLGLTVKTDYTVDPQTLKMSATSHFASPNGTQPLQLSVDLNALGLQGSYSFGTFKPAVLPDVYGVLFSVSKQFTKPSSSFIVFGPKGEYNCVASSNPAPFKDAASEKFAAAN